MYQHLMLIPLHRPSSQDEERATEDGRCMGLQVPIYPTQVRRARINTSYFTYVDKSVQGLGFD